MAIEMKTEIFAKQQEDVTNLDHFILSEIERQLNIKIAELDEAELDAVMNRCTLHVKQPLALGKKPKYTLRIKN